MTCPAPASSSIQHVDYVSQTKLRRRALVQLREQVRVEARVLAITLFRASHPPVVPDVIAPAGQAMLLRIEQLEQEEGTKGDGGGLCGDRGDQSGHAGQEDGVSEGSEMDEVKLTGIREPPQAKIKRLRALLGTMKGGVKKAQQKVAEADKYMKQLQEASTELLISTKKEREEDEQARAAVMN
jgi:hypothetical protein